MLQICLYMFRIHAENSLNLCMQKLAKPGIRFELYVRDYIRLMSCKLVLLLFSNHISMQFERVHIAR